MLMVIVGAGASHDSDPHRPPSSGVSPTWRPPLAKDLFDFRYGQFIDQYPTCRPLVRRLGRAATELDVSIEQEFQAILVEAANRKETVRQLAAARYYIRQMIESVTTNWIGETHGVTNYHELVDKLDAWSQRRGEPIIYVSFNYDTLIDTALHDALGFRCTEMSHYISSERTRLIKLHGSTNWRRIAQNLTADATGNGPWIGNWVIDRYPDLELTTTWEIGSPLESQTNSLVSVPAIAIPTETKGEADFELPPEHIETLRGVIPQVTRVIIIGWRGREAHFWNLWREARPSVDRFSVHIIDRDREAAATVVRTVVEAGMVQQAHVMPWDGFTNYLRNSDLSSL